MKYSFQPSQAQLKVASAVCSNLAAGWLAAIIFSKGIMALTMDILAATLALYLAVKIEQYLEKK